MNLTLIDKNNITYNLQDYGIQTIDFNIDSPSPIHNTEKISGRHGLVPLDTTLDVRTMRGSFFMRSTDSKDFQLKRNKLFQLFDARTEFYIIDSREENKRWTVRTASSYQIEKTSQTGGYFQIEFIAMFPFAESTFSTLSPDEHGQMLQVTQVNFNDPEVRYSFNTNTFFVWNDGEIVDPRESYLKITFNGASTNLQISNLTSGDIWSYTGSTIDGDEIVLEGIRALKNGLSILRDTNKKLIKLHNGWNQFEITGATSIESVSFDFRFLYL